MQPKRMVTTRLKHLRGPSRLFWDEGANFHLFFGRLWQQATLEVQVQAQATLRHSDFARRQFSPLKPVWHLEGSESGSRKPVRQSSVTAGQILLPAINTIANALLLY